jgi:hypothetical protein
MNLNLWYFIKFTNIRYNDLNAEGTKYISDALIKLINLNNLNLNLR